jgi:rhodanese-related sulfurtransferase
MERGWMEVSTQEVAERMEADTGLVLVDVRTLPEVVDRHIPGVLWVPLHELESRYDELPTDREVVVVCEHGIRSAAACRFLAGRGFRRLLNMTGGMSGWTGPVEVGLPSRTRSPGNGGARSAR